MKCTHCGVNTETVAFEEHTRLKRQIVTMIDGLLSKDDLSDEASESLIEVRNFIRNSCLYNSRP